MLELQYARRARRRNVDISCQVISSNWDEPVRHQIADMSPYGVWLKTSFPANVGERVVLSFVAPHGREITVFAEVARVVRRRAGAEKRGGMGLEFVDIGQRERIKLHRALRAMPRDERARLAWWRVARAS